VETTLIAIERCKGFEDIEPEPTYKSINKDIKMYEQPRRSKIKSLISKSVKKSKLTAESKKIFNSGLVTFENVSAKYPNASRNVIDNVTVEIKHGEKIGIVGRTGAGKSSFIKLLWKGITPHQGTIKIDGKDIS
jgi:ABC-type multidrug transport system fused ATPase/permease subunit